MRTINPLVLATAALTLMLCLGCNARSAGGGGATPPVKQKPGRVITQLVVADYDALRQASQEGRAGADEALTKAIRATAEGVAEDVAGRVGTDSARLLEVFRFTPSAVFMADQAGIQALRAHPDVSKVSEDTISKPQ